MVLAEILHLYVNAHTLPGFVMVKGEFTLPIVVLIWKIVQREREREMGRGRERDGERERQGGAESQIKLHNTSLVFFNAQFILGDSQWWKITLNVSSYTTV